MGAVRRGRRRGRARVGSDSGGGVRPGGARRLRADRLARRGRRARAPRGPRAGRLARDPRSEEHTSELQSRLHLVCRLLLEKKKKKKRSEITIIDTSIAVN